MRKVAAIFAGIAMGTALLGCLLNIPIWPGEAELTAPLFCAEPYNKPLVVSDTFVDSEGTSMNFTLYCLGERGQFTDEGFLLPWLALWAAHTMIVTVLALVLTALRQRPETSDST